MVELRKRKAPAGTAAVPPPPVKKANSVKSSNPSMKGLSSANGSASTGNSVAVGDTITVEGFGGEIDARILPLFPFGIDIESRDAFAAKRFPLCLRHPLRLGCIPRGNNANSKFCVDQRWRKSDIKETFG